MEVGLDCFLNENILLKNFFSNRISELLLHMLLTHPARVVLQGQMGTLWEGYEHVISVSFAT